MKCTVRLRRASVHKICFICSKYRHHIAYSFQKLYILFLENLATHMKTPPNTDHFNPFVNFKGRFQLDFSFIFFFPQHNTMLVGICNAHCFDDKCCGHITAK